MRIIFLSFCLSFFVFSVKSQDVVNTDPTEIKPELESEPEENADTESFYLTDSLIHFAEKYLKTPYRRGTNGPARFDCSGFTSFVYKNFGYALHRTASGQALVNGTTIAKDLLQKGDLVFFKGRNAKQLRVGHVGIVYEVFPDGTFSFIHASCNLGVTITSGMKEYYRTRYVTAKRIKISEKTTLEEKSKENTLSSIQPYYKKTYKTSKKPISKNRKGTRKVKAKGKK